MNNRCLAAFAAIAVFTAMPSFAKDSQLERAVHQIRMQTGGSVVSIHPDAGGRKFEAVVISPNGVYQAARYDAAGATVNLLGPVHGGTVLTTAQEMRTAKVTLPQAVKAAQRVSGDEPISAHFLSDPNANIIAYRVTTEGDGYRRSNLYIDARSGETLPASRINVVAENER